MSKTNEGLTWPLAANQNNSWAINYWFKSGKLDTFDKILPHDMFNRTPLHDAAMKGFTIIVTIFVHYLPPKSLEYSTNAYENKNILQLAIGQISLQRYCL